MNEDSSLLAVRPPKWNITKWFDHWGVSTCHNRFHVPFPCGDGQCCGDICKAKGDLCCKNDNGNTFPCQRGSKCCDKGRPGLTKYPVSKGTKCAQVHKGVTC